MYDFTLDKVTMSNFRIDNRSFQNIDKFLNQYNKSGKNSLTKFSIRNFVKEFFKVYAG